MRNLVFLFAILGVSSCGILQTTKLIRQMDLQDGVYAEMKTGAGDIFIKLHFEETPLTVANFVGLAEGGIENSAKPLGDPYYDGLKFHRVISVANGDGQDFMIQGGDPEGTGRGGPGYQFKDEFVPELKHNKPGILSMANAGPGTNGSQFFITITETPWLDNRHTVFGEVIKGQDMVKEIKQGETIHQIIIHRVGKKAKDFDAVKTFEHLK